jgi:TPR repeat protein
MKYTCSLTHQFTARFLIISLSLQSCGNLNSVPIAVQQATEDCVELTSQADNKYIDIVNKEFIAEGNHLVIFREEAGQVVADIEVSVPSGFTKRYEGLAVSIEKDTKLAQLPEMSKEAQRQFVHFNPPKNEQPGYIYVGNTGLKGGGNTDSKAGDNDIECYKKAAEQGHADAQARLGDMYYNGHKYTQAFYWYEKAAEQGHAGAQAALGDMYYKGEKGIAKDYDKAFYWYEKAAEQGRARAQARLGDMYYNGHKYTQAFYWYQKSAEQGHAGTQARLGDMYYNRYGVEKDDKKAACWYQKAAAQGHAGAQACLGNMYYNGYGVEKDYTQAVYWYQKAAEQGHAGKQARLGDMYYNGYGVEKDYTQAVYWYQKAAEQGHVQAQYDLGVMYDNGRGVTQDERKAVEWYKKAARQGHASAQCDLGWMYANGRGVFIKDERKAVGWYQKAADQGHAQAQLNLGIMYANGCGIVKDERQAVEWYQKAAEQGHVTAQNNLGVMYEYGSGVVKDERQAVGWYQKAAEQGNANAQNNLERLIQENYLLKATLTDFCFDANIDNIFSRQGKIDFIGRDILNVDRDTIGSTIARTFSKEIQKSFLWGLEESLGETIMAEYNVSIPLIGGIKGQISGNVQLKALQTWSSSKTYTIQLQCTLNPQREGVYEMSAVVYMLNNVTIPFTAHAKLTIVPKDAQTCPFTAAVVKKLYQINGCTYDLEHPIQQDNTSLTIKVKGKMTGTYDVKSFTSVKRLGDSSITGRDVSEKQVL